MNVLALIPARSGSKAIPHKNIATFHGKPLIAHSIEQALQARSITRVIVSTDSPLYASIAREFGAETPFLRPQSIAGDLATDLQAFQHALDWLKRHEGYVPDICVHLRPTYPTRRVKDIDQAVSMLHQDTTLDSVRSVVESPETPYKMWKLGDDDMISPLINSNELEIHDPWNAARQTLPKVYLQSGCIDAVRTSVIVGKNSMSGQRIRAIVMNDYNDIDTISQLLKASAAVVHPVAGKRLVFDIDGVIATLTPSNNYASAEPIQPTIDLINCLYDAGNTIILFTARGTTTGIDWSTVTTEQVRRWGVKHHELHFGKPAGDYYVDDRFISVSDLARLAQNNHNQSEDSVHGI